MGAEIKSCLAHFLFVFITFQLNLPITNGVTWPSLHKRTGTVEAPLADLSGHIQSWANWCALVQALPELVTSTMCFKDIPGKNVTHAQ